MQSSSSRLATSIRLSGAAELAASDRRSQAWASAMDRLARAVLPSGEMATRALLSSIARLTHGLDDAGAALRAAADDHATGLGSVVPKEGRAPIEAMAADAQASYVEQLAEVVAPHPVQALRSADGRSRIHDAISESIQGAALPRSFGCGLCSREQQGVPEAGGLPIGWRPVTARMVAAAAESLLWRLPSDMLLSSELVSRLVRAIGEPPHEGSPAMSRGVLVCEDCLEATRQARQLLWSGTACREDSHGKATTLGGDIAGQSKRAEPTSADVFTSAMGVHRLFRSAADPLSDSRLGTIPGLDTAELLLAELGRLKSAAQGSTRRRWGALRGITMLGGATGTRAVTLTATLEAAEADTAVLRSEAATAAVDQPFDQLALKASTPQHRRSSGSPAFSPLAPPRQGRVPAPQAAPGLRPAQPARDAEHQQAGDELTQGTIASGQELVRRLPASSPGAVGRQPEAGHGRGSASPLGTAEWPRRTDSAGSHEACYADAREPHSRTRSKAASARGQQLPIAREPDGPPAPTVVTVGPRRLVRVMTRGDVSLRNVLDTAGMRDQADDSTPGDVTTPAAAAAGTSQAGRDRVVTTGLIPAAAAPMWSDDRRRKVVHAPQPPAVLDAGVVSSDRVGVVGLGVSVPRALAGHLPVHVLRLRIAIASVVRARPQALLAGLSQGLPVPAAWRLHSAGLDTDDAMVALRLAEEREHTAARDVVQALGALSKVRRRAHHCAAARHQGDAGMPPSPPLGLAAKLCECQKALRHATRQRAEREADVRAAARCSNAAEVSSRKAQQVRFWLSCSALGADWTADIDWAAPSGATWHGTVRQVVVVPMAVVGSSWAEDPTRSPQVGSAMHLATLRLVLWREGPEGAGAASTRRAIAHASMSLSQLRSPFVDGFCSTLPLVPLAPASTRGASPGTDRVSESIHVAGDVTAGVSLCRGTGPRPLGAARQALLVRGDGGSVWLPSTLEMAAEMVTVAPTPASWDESGMHQR